MSLGGGGNKDEYLQYLQSNAFTARFIEDEKLLPVLFADRWDAENDRWKVDDPADVPTLADGVRTVRRAACAPSRKSGAPAS